MTARQTSVIRTVLLGTVAALVMTFCYYATLALQHAIAAAHAQGLPAGIATSPGAQDPTAHPIEAAQSAWGMVHQYGWLWGVMLVLAVIGAPIVKSLDGNHWLRNAAGGRIYYVLTGLTTVSMTVAVAHFGGGSWAAVPPTLLAAVMLVITPTPLATAAAPQPDKVGGK